MEMLILNGSEVSRARRERLKSQIEKFHTQHGFAPGLAVVLVGEDPASQVYVRNKIKACGEVGIASSDYRLSSSATMPQVLEQLDRLHEDRRVHGILVQLPLPRGLHPDQVLTHLLPSKDADGLTYENVGLFVSGKPRVIPCTPKGVMSILEHYKISVAGKRAVVVGRSQIVGKPMAQLLLNADATVTICHSKTPNLEEITREADILVVAAGKARMLGRDAIRKGAVVVDVGMHRNTQASASAKLCGDVRFEELNGWASAATPVPGGVGPMTITSLLENTLALAQASVVGVS